MFYIYSTIYDLHLLGVSHILPMLRSVYRASFKIISSNFCANALKRKYQLKHTHTHTVDCCLNAFRTTSESFMNIKSTLLVVLTGSECK